MSRRHNIDRDYIDWLKSIGCVFYAAFDAENGATDLINNVPFVASGSGSIQYDAAKDMYRLTSPSMQGSDIGGWDNGISNATTFSDNNFSFCYTIQKITNVSGKAMFGVAPYSNAFRTCQALYPSYNSTGNSPSWPTGVANVAYVHNYTEGWRELYQQGAVYTRVSTFAAFVPENWVLLGSGIRLGRTPVDPNTSYIGSSLYIKNAYVFNRVLDLGTLRKIQGYD